MNKTDFLLPPIPANKENFVTWPGLTGCGDSLMLAAAVRNENRLFVIITPDNQTALRLEQELSFFLQNEQAILHFPDWETLPYDVFSPLPEIISERLKTLALLPQAKRGALVVSVTTLMHRLAPREHVLANSFSVKVGDNFNLELNRLKLESVGYQCVSQVYQHGEFAVRGSIIDLFPMGSKAPFRIELFDEEIESIRTFDPETQRSLDLCKEIQLFPAREFPFTDESIKFFRQAFRDAFPEASPKNMLYTDVSKGITPSGIEYYLPLFVEKTAALFDYLPANAVLVTTESYEAVAKSFFTEAEDRFQQRKYNVDRPLLAPEKLFLTAPELAQRLSGFQGITLDYSANKTSDALCYVLPDLIIDNKGARAGAETPTIYR